MLSGCRIDSKFLKRWERYVCVGLEHGTGRPFSLIHSDQLQGEGIPFDVWLIDPVLASLCRNRPCACGFVMRFEPEGEARKLWVGVGVNDEPVLGGFLRDSLGRTGFQSSVRPLFKRLDAAGFMGQGSWVQSMMTSGESVSVPLTSSSLERAATVYDPAVAGARFLVIEVHRVYETTDDMELDADRVASRFLKDFGPLYNGFFPRAIDR